MGSFYAEKNWGEVQIDWATHGAGEHATLDYARTNVTLRVLGIDDGEEHLRVSVPLSAVRRDARVLDRVTPADMEATLACAASSLRTAAGSGGQRLSPACAAFMGACTPALELRHSALYFAGHTVVIGGLAVATLLIVLSPCLAWGLGPYLPGKRPAAFAVVAVGLAAVWAFIQSMH